MSYVIVAIVAFLISSIISLLIIKLRVKPLEKTIDELDVATIKMREEFSANVSHELKTPLTAISGYAEIIEQGVEDPKDNVYFAEKIKKEAGRLLSLINDIIRISELDESERKVQFTKVNLLTIINDCLDMLKNSAEKNQVELIFDRLPVGEIKVKGDETMIRELVYNLVDNAIRYNKPGGKVHVGINKEKGVKSIYVEDTGIGIPDKYKDRIFERFFRVDKSRSKKTGGTGLGLSIVKHIAMLHKAKIVVEGKENEGTKITVIFN